MSLAARGQRDLDNGPEAIDDAAALAVVRRQARSVMVQSLVMALVVTGIVAVIPV